MPQMKLALFTLLLLTSPVFAAERPKGFAGIPWGASPEEAKRILKDRPGIKFPEDSDDYKVEVTGGSFAGQPVTKWVLEFPERKFASGTVTLKTESNASAIHKEFRAQLASKYGSPSIEKKLGNAPAVRKGYGMERPTALGSIVSWRFSASMKEKTVVVVSAELAAAGGKPANDEAGLGVTIRYVNESLTGGPAGSATAKVTHAPVKKEDL